MYSSFGGDETFYEDLRVEKLHAMAYIIHVLIVDPGDGNELREP